MSELFIVEELTPVRTTVHYLVEADSNDDAIEKVKANKYLYTYVFDDCDLASNCSYCDIVYGAEEATLEEVEWLKKEGDPADE